MARTAYVKFSRKEVEASYEVDDLVAYEDQHFTILIIIVEVIAMPEGVIQYIGRLVDLDAIAFNVGY